MIAPNLPLLADWKHWDPTKRPYVLDADRDVLLAPGFSSRIADTASWQEAYSADDFARPGDRRLHLGLIPQPFCGDLVSASVYVLLLNPGLSPTDYYGEELPQYRNALLATLRQDFSETEHPFLFLDPRFAWHGGFRWWHGKLAGVIEALASAGGETFAAARARLAGSLASIELVPYHSASFRGGQWTQRLASARLAREFVSSYVLLKVQRDEAIVIVTRQVEAWKLKAEPGVVLYSAQQARGAYLTPKSPGGDAIIKRLAR
jgi:hypothetical protein